jgi:hypothetical protein
LPETVKRRLSEVGATGLQFGIIERSFNGGDRKAVHKCLNDNTNDYSKRKTPPDKTGGAQNWSG